MADYSTIEWTDHTFNPWWGCTKVSPAELQDWFARLTGNEFVRAVRYASEARLPLFEAAYLAATIEHVAAIRGVDPPPWTAAVEALEAPWFASSLKSLRLYLLTHSPPPYRRRNLFIDSSVGQRV